MTVEDIFQWIKKAYLTIKDDTTLIKNAFKHSGFIHENLPDYSAINLMEIEEENQEEIVEGLPFEDDEDEFEEKIEDEEIDHAILDIEMSIIEIENSLDRMLIENEGENSYMIT